MVPLLASSPVLSSSPPGPRSPALAIAYRRSSRPSSTGASLSYSRTPISAFSTASVVTEGTGARPPVPPPAASVVGFCVSTPAARPLPEQGNASPSSQRSLLTRALSGGELQGSASLDLFGSTLV